MEYKKILTTLRRYSFSEKMRIANKYSRQIMSPKGLLEPDSLAGRPLPWDIETFVIFAVVAKEWQNNNFIGKNEKVFIEIINSILEYCPPTLEKCKESFLFTDFYLVLAGSVQYDIQEYYPYKLYRHNFYFSFVNEKVNMPALFFKKFGCDYKDFMVFSTFLWCAYTSGANISQSIYDYWLSKYNICSNALSISRENFIKQVEKFSETPDDYRYCLRPSYSFPFVVEGNLTYLPLPHLLMRAVTSSLMFRITEKDNDLANLIGKEVLEPYLFKIIKESFMRIELQ